MVIVPSGARLTLHTSDGVVPLRSLAAVRLGGQWSIPVLTVAGQLLAGLAGEVEIAGEREPLRVQAHLVSDGTTLWLRPGLGVAMQVQRRDDVRADVRLPVRAAMMVPPARLRPVPAPQRGGLSPRRGDPAPHGSAVRLAAWDGTTISLSAGGLGVLLDATPRFDRLQIEVDLPDGRQVPAVISVVARHPRVLRARFEEIDPVDRERLVRLVFVHQRAELAARARLTRAWPPALMRD